MNYPEQYKTGIAYFMDYEFIVTPYAFIPRPETELLVEKTIETVKELSAIRVLDLCTGCGNIAISLTKYLSQSKITALDISQKAICTAYKNAKSLGVSRIYFVLSDLFSAIKKIRYFDIIVCNPPYISKNDMQSLPDEVKAEPFNALFGGSDGLHFYGKIAAEAKDYLTKRGCLIMEMGYDQKEKICGILREEGYVDIEVFKDYSGIERIVKARI